MSSGKAKFKEGKNKKKALKSRIKDSAHGQAAVDAATNDDFVTIVKHNLLRRKSIKMMVKPTFEKNIYEQTIDRLDHVEVVSAEELERLRVKKEADEAREKRRLELEEFERQKRLRLEKEAREKFERLEREAIEKAQQDELDRLRKEEEDRIAEELRLQQRREEAEKIRQQLEQQRIDKEERERKERKAAYNAKIEAVMNANNQKDREKAMKEVGKLSVADFGSQEEWERHQREVGKLNILEIAGQFKKKKFRKERRKTQTINWSSAKNMISKFQAINLQEDVIRFVKPTAVNLDELEDDELDALSSPCSPSTSGIATPDLSD